MLYLYDRAISRDLEKSFNPENVPNPVVKVVDPEAAIGIAAQIQDDAIQYPVVVVNRNPSAPIDRSLLNFTRLHRGVSAVLDEETNELYYERAVPVDLRYALTVLATNTADMDELVRELVFKYTNMYFLSIQLPYEADRRVRFGVILDPNSDIERSSGNLEYIQGGKLYQAIIPLKIEGAVMVSYTSAKLRRLQHEIDLDSV